MSPEERARAILRPLTDVIDHPSASWNPRAWHIPRTMTFDEMAYLIVEQIQQAEKAAYRLGLTRAAEICNQTFSAEQEAGDVDENFHDNAWTRICARLILTERDKP